MNKIRNIRQTAQEREIIKTAPDVVVYLDGKPYLLNKYITSDSKPYTIVTFNDNVVGFQTTYDVDNLIPSASISLSIPNHQKYLYQAPGGNNVIETMTSVQVFAKGYFPAKSGNTVYHRIFKGVTSHVSHTDNGTSLEISVQCMGVLHFLELMYMDLNPALMTNSDRLSTPYTSNEAHMTPYQILADVFLRGITQEGFQLNAIQQASVQNSDFSEAVKAGYIAKWQSILVDIRKDVHILGYKMGEVLPQDIDGISKKNKDAQGTMNPQLLAAKNTLAGKTSPTDPTNDYYVDIIRGYLPDMGFGTIQLLNGRIVSRIERIRTIVNLIGYEGYQDLDGSIIFKPPLYNLDVTNVGKANASEFSSSKPQPTVDIVEENNPFVVHLSEIESESESEDQAAIRSTRMTIQPNWIPGLQWSTGDGSLRPAITHIDIPKLSKFGLREEPARTVSWLARQDKVAAYVYAVSELNRANRGWRTYSITIPFRPELKLGFPMYFPHKDMYGYIKTITMTYQYGGAATTSILLDTIRKRPMFESTHTENDEQGQPKRVKLFTPQPNLVMEWTTPQNKDKGSTSNTTQPSTVTGTPQNTTSQPTGAVASGTGDTASEDPAVNLEDNPTTQRQPEGKPVWAEEMEVIKYRRREVGTTWATKSDTKSKSFRVQNDKLSDADKTMKDDATGKSFSTNLSGDHFFSAENWSTARPRLDANGNPMFKKDANGQDTNQQLTSTGVNIVYLQKIVTAQPYTDEGGYELVTPFPWGRWKDLHTALNETRLGNIVEQPNPEQAKIIAGTNVFLFAGVGTPTGDLGPSGNLQQALSQIVDATSRDATFELQTPQPGDPSNDGSILKQPEPDIFFLQQSNDSVQYRTDMFLLGNVAPNDVLQNDLNTADTRNTRVKSTTPIGVTPPSAPQKSSFLDKLIKGNS